MTERIRINVDGIDFDVDRITAHYRFLSIGGLPVPSEQVLNALMRTIPDTNSRRLFVLASNNWVDYYEPIFNAEYYLPRCDPSAVEEFELRTRLIEIDKNLCEITVFSFNYLRYVKALISWHEALRGNDTSSKHTGRRKQLSSLKKVLKGKITLSSFKPIIKDNDYQILLRFDERLTLDEYLPCYEYLQAINYRRQLNKTIDYLLLTNQEIRNLVAEMSDIQTKLSSKVEADPLLIPNLFCCPFCKKCKLLIEDVKTPKSCGSSKCQKAYSAATTRKNSNQPHAANKKSSLPPKAFDGISKICTGCGKKRVIYQWIVGNLCKQCGERDS